MAPQKPSATALRHARITNSIHPLAPQKTFRQNASTTDSFLSSKRDKRTIKHSSFVSRISSSSRISKSSKPRRGRGAKKSATLNSLDSLADALPELADGEGAAEILDGKIKHQSLRSKKGALKRKERLLKGEMARFGVSMAQLSHLPAQTQSAVPEAEKPSVASLPVSSAPTSASAASNRWAALRGYISATMEQNPAFVNKE
ncbi:ribosome biogenesis protein SLX9 domain-containing protein [Trichoderma breve]|uniref:Ribosome biogenesis protein SLX9 n=1 Tax=Trichoderma breve TaxID=2034170 RepID=A0A9W9E3B6_9HYPO|nr:ribosome biogenesis protein SLX9 domain-containing protein [Trichoderma breve]KAJ4854932.1 ribosome biogenesis protein SLX9 domain-containing protein [Trichoderma breve]